MLSSERFPRPNPSSNVDRSNAPTAATSCCRKKPDGRNLIICIDGTSNQFGIKNTNVIELYNLIQKSEKQRTWYNSGIGTYARPSWKSLNYYKQVIYHKIDLAIAWDFERTILGAYQWLSDNYQDGDCIFMFGFSRGAYQVRVLSAMINKVGLILKGNEMQIPFAYELYADPKSADPQVIHVGTQKKEEERVSMAERFKKAFSQDVKVHFVGVWDTVSSIGVMRGKNMLPGTVNGMDHVCYFRHALALDERRVKFLPEYAWGGKGKGPTENRKDTPQINSDLLSSADPSTAKNGQSQSGPSSTENAKTSDVVTELTGKRPQKLEVWFAGTHSDIGGGNTENAGMNRRKPPLRWMVLEARALGLDMAKLEDEFLKNEDIEIMESLTWHWWILEILPLKRLTYTRQENPKRFLTYKPHFGLPRKIHPGQKIHSSVLLSDKISIEYTPKARPMDDDSSFWAKLRTDQLQQGWLEFDLYEYTQTIVGHFVAKGDEKDLRSLHLIASKLADGLLAVCDKLLEALAKPDLLPDVRNRVLKSLMDIVQVNETAQGNPLFQLNSAERVYPILLDCWKSDNEEHRQTIEVFLGQFVGRSVYVLRGHNDGVSAVTFSPDGMQVASGSADNTIRIWDMETGEQSDVIFRGHTNWVSSVVFSPDGSWIASGSADKTVRVWVAETGEQLTMPFQGHTGGVSSVAFSPDGKCVASGSVDKTIRIWDAETGEELTVPFQGHKDQVSSVAFSPDGSQVVSGSVDKTIRLWDAMMGDQLIVLEGHSGRVSSVAFSPDGRQVVSGSGDKTIRMWNVQMKEQVTVTFEGHSGQVSSVAFSPDGRRVVSGSADKTVRIWDVETGGLLTVPFKSHTDWISSVAFSPDGQWLASGSADKTIRIWDVGRAEQLTVSFHEQTGRVTVASSPDAKQGVSSRANKTTHIWDKPERGRQLGVPFQGHTGQIFSVAFSHDGKWVVSGSADNTIRVWEAETGEPFTVPFQGHTNWVYSTVFSPDGKLVISGSVDKTVCIWDAVTREQLTVLEGHSSWVSSVALSPDGKRIASGSADKTIRIWDAVMAKELTVLLGHQSQVSSVAFSPDGNRVVSGSTDKSIRIWDTETRGQLTVFEGHADWVSCVAFSPDGRYLVSGSGDKTVRIWEVETGKQSGIPLEGHTDWVSSVAFSPDGKWIASGSADKTIRIWDLETREQSTVPFEGHTSWVSSIAFSPDGKWVVSGSADKTIRIWDMAV